MPKIIEDGSIVQNANSYVSVSEVRAYANERGVVFDNSDTDLEFLLTVAKDYLESKRNRFQGTKVSYLQSLQFPRVGVFVDGFELDPTSIPKLIKDAQCRLVIEIASGIELMPTTAAGPFLIEDTVGPITQKWSDKVAANAVPEMSAVDALLEPLFARDANVGIFLRTYRA